MISEMIVCIISLLFSIFLFYFARFFPTSQNPDIPSAAFFPFIISTLLFGLSVLNIAKGILSAYKGKKDGTYVKEVFQKGKVIQIVMIVLFLFLYVILWYLHVGTFILNSIVVFVPVCMLMSNEKAWWQNALFAIFLVLFIYVLFSFLLRVRLW
ncbi:MAG: PAM68 family protein [Spirochaetia bacterium]|jgi:hypothetical protein|nr:PAM68 family protein [Spirochaetia bacterium]